MACCHLAGCWTLALPTTPSCTLSSFHPILSARVISSTHAEADGSQEYISSPGFQQGGVWPSKGHSASSGQVCIPASPGESGLVTRGSQGLRSPLESRRGSLGAPERPQGSPASSSFWREDPGSLSRPCRKRGPSAREDGGVSVKELTLQCRRCEFDPWIGKVLWSRKWQPTPVFLPGMCVCVCLVYCRRVGLEPRGSGIG